MRLLNARTKQFEEFYDEVPPYAILSHTWGPDELTYKHMEQKGYVPSKKIDGCCKQALKDRIDFVWVDTCCIDKSSSAELSEAINSMWKWYRRSEMCYAYLSDVPPDNKAGEANSKFSDSRWFTRGWTLQELIAPWKVVFYDEAWGLIGRKSGRTGSRDDEKFTQCLSQITGIDDEVLKDPSSFRYYSVAQRMSWASNRTTTRVEDSAYSLLGLFEINMPLLYGEGNRAFQRLQEEILRASDDETIFARDFGKSFGNFAGGDSLFANQPADFSSCGSMIPVTLAGLKPSHYTLTNKGLHIEVSICYLPFEGGMAFVRLNCAEIPKKEYEARAGNSLAIAVVQSRENDKVFSRPCLTPPIYLSSEFFSNIGHIYIHRFTGHIAEVIIPRLAVRFSPRESVRNMIKEFYPPHWRGILRHELHNIIQGNQRKTIQSGHQDILFLVDHTEWKPFAVWIDYRFSLSADNVLQPRELKCWVAIAEGDKTLAELVLLKSGSTSPIEEALDWKEVLDLESVELRTELDKTEQPWTVRIKAHH